MKIFLSQFRIFQIFTPLLRPEKTGGSFSIFSTILRTEFSQYIIATKHFHTECTITTLLSMQTTNSNVNYVFHSQGRIRNLVTGGQGQGKLKISDQYSCKQCNHATFQSAITTVNRHAWAHQPNVTTETSVKFYVNFFV